MEINKLPSPGNFGSAGELYKQVFKAINSVEQNHLYNGRRDTHPTPQVVDLKQFFLAAAEHLDGILPKPQKKGK